MVIYLLIFLGAVLLATAVAPLAIQLARKFNVVDIPDLRKVHSKPIPRIGGIVIYIPMMAAILSLFLFDNTVRSHLLENKLKITTLLSVTTFIFFVGLTDDIKGLRARTKILCQLTASIVVCALGFRINSIGFSESQVLHFGWFSWPLTIFWIVGITNAVNLIDGLDGLAAGLSAVACGVMVVLSIHFEQIVMCVIMTSLLGALIGFLFFNFNPAKIFMGDCGSLFLGFTIASSSVIFAAKSHALVSLTLPILALGIPIFDTLFSIARRFLERRSLFSPDFEHFHHRLLATGLKQRHIVIAAYLITLFAAGFGMFMIFTRSMQSITIFVCILTLLLLAFRLFGLVKLGEILVILRKKHILSNHIRLEKEGFEKARLHFCRAKTFSQWWESVCAAATNMNFNSVLLPLTNRDGSTKTLTWGNLAEESERQNIIKMFIPISDRRRDSALELKVDINTNGSLESAGRRARLFNRLLEEYGVAQLAT